MPNDNRPPTNTVGCRPTVWTAGQELALPLRPSVISHLIDNWISSFEFSITPVESEFQSKFAHILLASPELMIWACSRQFESELNKTKYSKGDSIHACLIEMADILRQLLCEQLAGSQPTSNGRRSKVTLPRSIKRFKSQLTKWRQLLDKSNLPSARRKSVERFVKRLEKRMCKFVDLFGMENDNTTSLKNMILGCRNWLRLFVGEYAVGKKNLKQIRAQITDDSKYRLESTASEDTIQLLKIINVACMKQQQLNDAKLDSMKQLAYGASHEVNNPLANIATRAQVLLQDETNPTRRQRLAMIEQQAMRAHEMIANMMYFAHPPDPAIGLTSLNKIVSAVCEQMSPQCKSQGTRLLQTSDEDDFSVNVDREQIAMAISLIIRNSMESLGNGGSIQVRLVARKDEIYVEIIDDGPGFDDLAAENLFDPFFSGREAGRGLGLGLSKVWRIAELNKVGIQIDSCRDKATKIQLIFKTHCLKQAEKSANTISFAENQKSPPAA